MLNRKISQLLWRQFLAIFALTLYIGVLPLAKAQIDVPLSAGEVSDKMAIVVADFSGSNGKEVADIVAADLERSGQFEVQRVESLSNDSKGTPNWSAIKSLNLADPIVLGHASSSKVSYHLADPTQESALESKDFSEDNVRKLAHRVADAAYENQTGVRGAFSTRVAYSTGNKLFVADADGEREQTVASSSSSIISPAWSPDGSKLAYVSFEKGKPVVYVQDLKSGSRKEVADFKGNNSAPAWSPDGSRLAVALSKDALSNIYLISSDGGSSATPLTNSSEIDTEPYFFPNGSGIIFTSDRGGSAQIYRTGMSGGSASRLTYTGSQNVSGKLSPDGLKLVYASLRGGSYSIALSGLGSGSDELLTHGPNDLSPSFAPNGMQVLYVASGGLAIVNIDGSFKTTIPSSGNITSATWGPFID